MVAGLQADGRRSTGPRAPSRLSLPDAMANDSGRLPAAMTWTRQHVLHAVAVTVVASFLAEVIREVALGELSAVTRALVGQDGAAFLRSMGSAWRAAARQHPDLAWLVGEFLIIATLA